MQRRKKGLMNLIPFYTHFPRLSKFIPGLFRQGIYKILSGTGVGKSKLARFMSVVIPYELSKTSNIKFHTLFFALEESKEEFIDSMILTMLYKHHGIKMDRLTLNSYFQNPLDEGILEKIVGVQSYVEDIMTHVTVFDDIRNPTGIYKACEEFSKTRGKHHMKKIKLGESYVTVQDRYEADDEEEFIIVVVDHISLLQSEYSSLLRKSLSKRECMELWNDNYCSRISNKWNWITLNIQQTAMSSDDVSHQKANRLEPELSDAGDNKTILRTDKVIFALFDPSRYGLKTYNGINIAALGDNFRAMKILKNRYGISNRTVPLFFEGASGRFNELKT